MNNGAKRRVGILISGRGSNMLSLIEAAKAPDFPAQIVAVGSNKPEAKGLETASKEGFATFAVDHKLYGKDREAFERDLDAKLRENNVELLVLAGFLRLLTPWFVHQWQGRMINIHPALLPSFTGLHTHERALTEGVRIHGATVHFVTAEMDVGPIIAQGAVPVLDGDTPDALAARVLEVEHRIYPIALEAVASGKVHISGLRVKIDNSEHEGDSLIA
ncbi:phosphoribosylglycinamide formyltransferase [Pseudovibrio sp. Tun.PSC04-5.I4]|uniref:phosphoribosylglycinamide formyltransferase n=1 Tax=Pseudovibrio sp. Tun.PSC04-5.I4 TaxID=1798213 RepID=UPI0008880C2E|nr:phosphoribosylglycinamide formyltransferase [Pseudovibrio sp. Tun.PSC04-5.I4]SDQ95871.1 phosphoribosylglycinamide formyltransferase-1 [Pseudovibrio sp. Tun.PSC04-5.I4]